MHHISILLNRMLVDTGLVNFDLERVAAVREYLEEEMDKGEIRHRRELVELAYMMGAQDGCKKLWEKQAA